MGRSWEAPGWALVKYGRKFALLKFYVFVTILS